MTYKQLVQLAKDHGITHIGASHVAHTNGEAIFEKLIKEGIFREDLINDLDYTNIEIGDLGFYLNSNAPINVSIDKYTEETTIIPSDCIGDEIELAISNFIEVFYFTDFYIKKLNFEQGHGISVIAVSKANPDQRLNIAYKKEGWLILHE